jgi:hypothetical protein
MSERERSRSPTPLSESPSFVPRPRVPELTRDEAIQVLRLVDALLPDLIDMRDSLGALLYPREFRTTPPVFVTGMCLVIHAKIVERINEIQEIIVNAAPMEETTDDD